MKSVMKDYQITGLDAISDIEIKQNPSHLVKSVNTWTKLSLGGRGM